jgi:uncharacterized metal-binding protein
VTVLLSAGLGYAAHYRLGYPVQASAALAGGALAGIFLSPDLDVDGGSISFYHVRHVAGCLPGLVWSWIWRPYARLIPHRSPLSHWPVISTLIRLGYLSGMVYSIFWVLLLANLVSHPAIPAWGPLAIAGLVLSDTCHFVMDKTIHTHHTRRKRYVTQKI